MAIGASAGGLHPLQVIVRALEERGVAAYVVAQHLSPSQPSNLAEILAQDNALTVVVAADATPLRPDHIYICPAGLNIEIEGRRLRLGQPTDGALLTPSIDRLFASAAASFGSKTVAVVLSGAGHDGATGVTAVAAAGGQIVTQSPDDAAQGSMPLSAIQASPSARAAGAEQIAEWLSRVETLGSRTEGESCDPFAELLARVSSVTGLDLSQYKESTLRRQTSRRYHSLGLDSIHTYLALVAEDVEELQRLQRHFLISVSSFFRDPTVFAVLETALRRMLRGKSQGDAIRVWVPACATGEEAYSIAILIADILGERMETFDLRVFATDVDSEALEVARAGVYSSAELDILDKPRLERWLVRQGDRWTSDHRRGRAPRPLHRHRRRHHRPAGGRAGASTARPSGIRARHPSDPSGHELRRVFRLEYPDGHRVPQPDLQAHARL